MKAGFMVCLYETWYVTIPFTLTTPYDKNEAKANIWTSVAVSCSANSLWPLQQYKDGWL
jgi:hypothetical protein